LLAVTNRTRATAVPEVPTVAEAGFPVLEMEGILGLYGWRGIPAAVRDERTHPRRAAYRICAGPALDLTGVLSSAGNGRQ
jgi:hypothetical protein